MISNGWQEVRPVLDAAARKWCTLRYPNHPKGCPNFNKKAGCPPKARLFIELFDLKKPFYIIFNKFNFKAHCDRMRKKHPEWTDRQVRCCLYWQGTARKQLREIVAEFVKEHPDLYVTNCPEANGVDITRTMERIGIKLEWPPMKFAYQVVMAGTLRRKKCRKK